MSALPPPSSHSSTSYTTFKEYGLPGSGDFLKLRIPNPSEFLKKAPTTQTQSSALRSGKVKPRYVVVKGCRAMTPVSENAPPRLQLSVYSIVSFNKDAATFAALPTDEKLFFLPIPPISHDRNYRNPVEFAPELSFNNFINDRLSWLSVRAENIELSVDDKFKHYIPRITLDQADLEDIASWHEAALRLAVVSKSGRGRGKSGGDGNTGGGGGGGDGSPGGPGGGDDDDGTGRHGHGGTGAGGGGETSGANPTLTSAGVYAASNDAYMDCNSLDQEQQSVSPPSSAYHDPASVHSGSNSGSTESEDKSDGEGVDQYLMRVAPQTFAEIMKIRAVKKLRDVQSWRLGVHAGHVG